MIEWVVTYKKFFNVNSEVHVRYLFSPNFLPGSGQNPNLMTDVLQHLVSPRFVSALIRAGYSVQTHHVDQAVTLLVRASEAWSKYSRDEARRAVASQHLASAVDNVLLLIHQPVSLGTTTFIEILMLSVTGGDGVNRQLMLKKKTGHPHFGGQKFGAGARRSRTVTKNFCRGSRKQNWRIKRIWCEH